jgi:hypothetical protein
VFIGRVVGVTLSDAAALVWERARFHRLAPI